MYLCSAIFLAEFGKAVTGLDYQVRFDRRMLEGTAEGGYEEDSGYYVWCCGTEHITGRYRPWVIIPQRITDKSTVAIHRHKMLDNYDTREHVPELNETLKAEVQKHWPFKIKMAA